jgi:hypothetical protein
MNTIKTTERFQADRRRKRLIWFTMLAALLTLLLFIGGIFEFIPSWILRNPVDDPHLWHIAELTALSLLLLGGTMLGITLYPLEQPLLVQFFVVSMVILGIGITPFDFRGAVCLLIGGAVVLAYPNRRALLSLKSGRPISKVLLISSLVFAVFLDPLIWQEVNLQVLGQGTGEIHAQFLHWIGSALLYILLIVGGLLASTRRPGWKALSAVTGITYCFLGIVAMLSQGYAGSWGEFGGLFATFGGVLYLMLAFVVSKDTPASESTPISTLEADAEDTYIHHGEAETSLQSVVASQARS